MKEMLSKLVSNLGLNELVPGRYLGLFRMFAFGLIAFEVIQFGQRGYMTSFLVESRVRFPYEFLPISIQMGSAGLNFLLGIVIGSAVLCSLGLFYRHARWAFIISFFILFFQDKMLWNNHWYLFLLIGIGCLFMDLGKTFSLDSILKPKSRSDFVPRWYYQVLALQVGQAYFFGGIAKLNHDWLVLHQPIQSFLAQRTDYFLLGSLFAQPWASAFFSVGGVLFDLSIVFLLWNKRLLNVGLGLSIIFNLTNAIIFDIGMFPYFMIVANLLFLGLGLKTSLTSSSPFLAPRRWETTLLVAFLGFQFLFPFRQFLYKGNPSWVGICERFSWRMMIQTKDVESFKFYAVDTRNGNRQEIDLSTFLFPQQMIALVVFPDMVAPAAKQMKTYFAKTGLKSFEVHAELKASMNGRPFQHMIDQEVALSNYKYQPFLPPSYVIPLE